jgi:stringent starvation protein B
MAQVFISHSSRDEWLIKPICEWLKASGVEPYLAEFETTATPLPEKFDKAIRDSNAVVVIFTRNVANIQKTRDVVNWETCVAYTHKKPVYILRENGVELPFMFNYITDYFTFDPFNVKTLKAALQRLYDIGLKIKKDEDTGKLVLAGLLIVFGLWQLFKK